MIEPIDHHMVYICTVLFVRESKPEPGPCFFCGDLSSDFLSFGSVWTFSWTVQRSLGPDLHAVPGLSLRTSGSARKTACPHAFVGSV